MTEIISDIIPEVIPFTKDPLGCELTQPHCYFKPIVPDLLSLQSETGRPIMYPHVWIIDRKEKVYKRIVVENVISVDGGSMKIIYNNKQYQLNIHPESIPVYTISDPEGLQQFMVTKNRAS
ncbi:hypothetical protein KC866_02415 [Patescibacteria group bacterium]|nr:hypothetical protein [Patescibacteria group bacterium]